MGVDVIDSAIQSLNDIKVVPDNKFESCINCIHFRTGRKARSGRIILFCIRDYEGTDEYYYKEGSYIGAAWQNELIHKNTRYILKSKQFRLTNSIFSRSCEFFKP